MSNQLDKIRELIQLREKRASEEEKSASRSNTKKANTQRAGASP